MEIHQVKLHEIQNQKLYFSTKTENTLFTCPRIFSFLVYRTIGENNHPTLFDGSSLRGFHCGMSEQIDLNRSRPICSRA
jgi:hypothetical protein